ncbi:MAG: hypothetical protein ACXQTI_10405, partial [Candidatus Nezhaarchaeales archaeon]
RDQLSAQGHVQHVIELATQIEKVSNELLDYAKTPLESSELAQTKVSIDAKKVVIDTKMKLIGKYLGDMKSIEHSGEVKQVVIEDKNVLEEMLRAEGIDPEVIKLQ